MTRWKEMLGMATLALGLLVGCSDSSENKPKPDAAVDQGTDVVTEAGKDQGDDSVVDDAAPKKLKAELIILHTNDFHSHLQGVPASQYSPATTGDDEARGGMARLVAAIKKERTDAGDTPLLLLDGGDFTMGTLFSFLGATQSPELLELQAAGYDAIAIGNHEFDWTSKGLASIIGAATGKGFDVPLLATNIQFDDSSAEDDELDKVMQSGAIVRKLVKKLDGLTVGVIGLLGKDASDVAPLAAPVTFGDIIESAEPVVKELRETDKVDLVIALSHSGVASCASDDEADQCTEDGNWKGEDVELAKAVGIDVIISGHTHTAMAEPTRAASAWIVQTGAYGENLGRLKIKLFDDGSTEVDTEFSKLIPLDDAIEGDAETQTRIEGYIDEINKLVAPLAYDTEIAETDFDVGKAVFEEFPLGDLVTDAYLSVVKELESTEPPQIAIESPGVIRDPIVAGKLWLADVYRVLSTGAGFDGEPGNPLVTFYINGPELKMGMEAVTLAEGLGNNDFFLQIGGFTMEYVDDPTAIFNKVKKITLDDGTEVDLADKDTCYKLVLNNYVASLMDLLGSFGLPPIVPKESDCATEVTDLSTRLVDADPTNDGVQELKHWMALVKYLQSFDDTDGDGVPNVPAAYKSADKRIVKQ